MKNTIQCYAILFLIYVLFLESYRLEEYLSGKQLWAPVIGSIQKAGCIEGKEFVGTILGYIVGRIGHYSVFIKDKIIGIISIKMMML